MLERMGEEGVARRARQLAAFDPRVLDALIGGTMGEGFSAVDAIRAAHCPIVLVAGNRELTSALTPEDVSRLAAEPNVRVVRVDNEGHFIHEAEPLPCAAAVHLAFAA